MQVPATGLRERKHAQTRSRLEEAAVSLALKDGLDKTTIDAISETANVSPRTFFNYFDSKEDAILGVYSTRQNEEEMISAVQFDATDDITESVVELVMGLINPSKDSHKLHKKRTKLVRQYPVLMEKQIARITKISDALNAKVKAMVEIKHPQLDQAGIVSSSEVIVMICVGGVKVATKEWIHDGEEALTDNVKHRAVEIIKATMKVL